MSTEEKIVEEARGTRTNSGVIVGEYEEPMPPPSYAQAIRNNRINTNSIENEWINRTFHSGALMTDSFVNQPSIIVPRPIVPPLGSEPVFFTCPRCQSYTLTRIVYEPNLKTHLMAALLCLLGLWCCVCLPYCYERCVNIRHHCGNCGKLLGTYCNTL
uniref:LITAF domain-containing protein n=1 Tax=Glossina brevipalpis TaxID=37001 RepID=A0A1A9X4Z3_9MUSC